MALRWLGSELRDSLFAEASRWPTPDAHASSTRTNRSASPNAATRPVLGTLSRAWPTPMLADADRRTGIFMRGSPTLVGTCRSFRLRPAISTDGSTSSPRIPTWPPLFRLLALCWRRPGLTKALRLNPAFAEWLMGWPAGWSAPGCGADPTASASPATESSLYRQRWHCWLSSVLPEDWRC